MHTSVNRRWVLAGLGAGAGLAGTPWLGACSTHAPIRSRRDLALAPEIDAAVARAIALDLVPGFSVAVYSREGVYARGFGLADIDTRERVSADTAFYVASSTKSMTALAFACMHARGELNLDATLVEFSPESGLPPETRPAEVRLRDLLSHVGGILNRPINWRFAASGQHDPDTLWRLLAVSQANSDAPLGRFQYQNIGYNLATILSDRRLGVRWQELLSREIFEPAAMTRTTASMSRAKALRWSIAKPHRLGAAGARERNYLEKTDQTMHSAGGVIISAQDAARWLELIIEDGLVGGQRCVPAEVVQSTRTQLATVGVEFEGYRREAYGLGWYLGPYRNQRMLHHFGGFSGFRAHVSYLPDQAIGVAAFANDSTVSLGVINAIANYVYDRTGGYADANQQLQTALDSAATRYGEASRRIVADRASRANLPLTLVRPRAAYVGRYAHPHWGHIDIAAADSTLRVTCGVLHAIAEPYEKRDALWVELEPGDGNVLEFEGDGTTPAALTFEGRRFARAAS
jgi:CubicO group peptidase (beta-lactamase class C family)